MRETAREGGGISGRWNGPVATTTRRVCRAPSAMDTTKPPVAGVVERDHLGVLAHRRPRARRVACDEAEYLAVMREAIGIAARIRLAGQLHRPIRELETQRLPPFGAPPFPNAPPLQHHMLTPAPLQHGAHRQTGLAAPDDHCVMVLSHARLRTALEARIPAGAVPAEAMVPRS